jgi:hypothetical protein
MTIYLYDALSFSCKTLLNTKIGYRNDHYSTGHYKIKQVIDFEIEELSNQDIIDTCINFYGTDDVYAVIQRHFNTDNFDALWGLWLTTENGVKEYYKGSEEGYNSYSIPDKCLVISDIGEEGILFVLDQHPDNYLN